MIHHATPTEESSSLPPLTNPPLTNDLFSFRTYQKEDLARAALHDGAIIGWDPGLGKTMAIFTLPFIKQARYVLIVAPAGLHEQIIDEGKDKFGLTVTPIPDQDTALQLMRDGILPFNSHDSRSSHNSHSSHPSHHPAPQFFITSYNWLGYNGGDEWQPAEANELLRLRRITLLRRTPATEITTELVDIGWMLEELRVSVFAQQVGAAKGVSPAKITKALQSFGG